MPCSGVIELENSSLNKHNMFALSLSIAGAISKSDTFNSISVPKYFLCFQISMICKENSSILDKLSLYSNIIILYKISKC